MTVEDITGEKKWATVRTRGIARQTNPDLVDQVLKRITTKVREEFDAQFARMTGYASAAYLLKAVCRGKRHLLSKRYWSHRTPSHVLDKQELDKQELAQVYGQAVARRFA